MMWYVVCCGAKNGHQKENGWRAQNMVTILGSIADMMEGDLYDYLMSMGIFTLANE